MFKGLLFIGLSVSLFSQDIKFNGMTEYLNAVVKNNPKAYIEYLNTKIKLNEFDKEKALYEPIFVASVSTTAQNIQTSPEDTYFIENKDYNSRSNNGKLTLLGIAPTGAQWELSLENTRTKSSYLQNNGVDKQYGSYARVDLVQPLLKNFGEDITEIKVKSAEVMAEISEVEYKKIITDLVGVSIQAYWQLYGAKEVPRW